jgi:hypothetical protein
LCVILLSDNDVSLFHLRLSKDFLTRKHLHAQNHRHLFCENILEGVTSGRVMSHRNIGLQFGTLGCLTRLFQNQRKITPVYSINPHDVFGIAREDEN